MPLMARPFDVCIRGAGIVGRALALQLAAKRLRVALVDPRADDPTTGHSDVRAYALNAASRELLEGLRCWPDALQATPVLSMQVFGDKGGALRFDASEQTAPALNWMVDVPALEALLVQALGFQSLVTVMSEPCAAPLTVICEGKASSTRAQFGVDFDVQAYPQHALAARVACDVPHRQVARQWFSEHQGQGEILAMLPLDGEEGSTCAVVWSLSPERVHPLAGQGLNLGLGDVAALSKVLDARPYWRSVGDLRLLRAYARERKAALAMVGGVGDAMQQIFYRNNPLLQSARNWGMSAFSRSGPIKQWLARRAMDMRT